MKPLTLNMLTPNQVLHIAKLANLTLTEEEIPLYRQWLSETLDYVEVLNELDTTGVEPIYQVTNTKGEYRDDTEDDDQHLSQEEVLSNVGERKQGGYIVVEKVMWG